MGRVPQDMSAVSDTSDTCASLWPVKTVTLEEVRAFFTEVRHIIYSELRPKDSPNTVTFDAYEDDDLGFRWGMSLCLFRVGDDRYTLKYVMIDVHLPGQDDIIANIHADSDTRFVHLAFPHQRFAAFRMRMLPLVNGKTPVQVLKLHLKQRLSSCLRRLFGFPKHWIRMAEDGRVALFDSFAPLPRTHPPRA